MNQKLRCAAQLVALYATLRTDQAAALSIREFKKFSTTEQSAYITAAVSMLAYSYAAGGDVSRGRCVQAWFFGKRGAETPGPREIAIEMGVAEKLDPDHLHAEGVILGSVEKACGASGQVKQKQ